MLFCLPGNEGLSRGLADLTGLETGKLETRKFPDGEIYLRVLSDVGGRDCYIVSSLDRPDDKFLFLFFLSSQLKKTGANSVTLIAPYLSYMRQDKEFQKGECVTSEHYARMISGFVDRVVTVDPHLHRRKSMDEIYTIPVTVLHATQPVCDWIRDNLQRPVIIGPDEESRQWAETIAQSSGSEFSILTKTRKGDRDVEIHFSGSGAFENHVPVLVDDIISTGRTMIETIRQINSAGLANPVCIGVHGIFAENSWEEMQKTGARIVTTNSISHPSNAIDLAGLLASAIKK